jgi:undecaprenyl-diphosphatase
MLVLSLLVGAGWLLLTLNSEIREGDTRALDERLLLALREPGKPEDPWGPLWVEEMGRDLTALGGIAFGVMATGFTVVYLAIVRKFHTMGWVLFTILGGQALSLLLKRSFSRPRPSLVPHESYVYTSSFPSGHSMMAAVTFLSLAVFLMRLQPSFAARAFLMFAAVLTTFLVGFSRVYLGVHYPTDVLAGWAMGGAWAAFCALLLPALSRKPDAESAA